MQRRLTTIVAADVAGYSRLIGADEEGTLAAMRALRAEVIDPHLATHGGRVANTAGDSLLIEFPSAVEAVRCAIAVQEETASRAEDLPEDQRILFRIGVNVGDVVAEGEDLLGDGVNVAARLEALAPSGGIVISRTARDQVRDRLDLDLADLGEVEVKNIARPVRAFQVLKGEEVAIKAPKRASRSKYLIAAVALLITAIASGWWATRPDFTPADPAKMAAPLPRGPSIAVLPFDYLGPDEDEYGYIADGMSENIISALATVPDALVIARNSTFTYKGKAVDVREVSERFGVRYVLEGSVQISGDALRVTAQLVDGVDGRHLWTDVYDRQIAGIFAVQDEITLKVANAVFAKTMSGSIVPSKGGTGGTKSLKAWSEFVRGMSKLTLALPKPVLQSVAHFERAIELDPTYAAAYAALAHTYFFKARFFLSADPAAELGTAATLAQKALSLDPNEVRAYSALGMTRLIQKRGEEAADAVIRGAEIGASESIAQSSAAWVLTYLGRSEEALEYYAQAKRIYVIPPWWVFGAESQARADAGDFEGSANLQLEMAKYSPFGKNAGWHVGMASAYLGAGREDEARQMMMKAREMDPNLSIAEHRIWSTPYIDPALPERHFERLRALGLPEVPPSAD